MSNTPRLKPSDIDIRPFRPKNRLNPDFFDSDGSMNSRIRLGLLDIADDFVRMLEVKWVKPIDIVVTGSMVNYNWSKFSDVDIHIIYDFSKIYKKGEFVKDYFDAKKKCWNDSHQELTVKGFPVEISVEDVKEPAKSSGVYSLEKNKWVEEPKELDASELDTEKIKRFCAKKMTEMDSIFAKMDKEKDRKKLENLTKDLESVYDELKGMRKNGLASKEMEMSEGNIIWKVIKHAGYIDKCWDYYDKVYDRRNTIDEAVAKHGADGKPTAYLMIGMPGAGKSTWVKNNLPDLPVVSRDIIRGYDEVGVSNGVDDKKVGSKDQETLVTDIERREIKELCEKGEDFVVDDTNTGKYRKGMVDYIRSCGARVVGIYVETDSETCKSRRDGVIPGDAMDRMFGRMIKPNAEEFDDFKVVSGKDRTVVINEKQMREIQSKLNESLDEAAWPDFNPHEIEKITYFAQRVRWCNKNLGPCFGSGSARMIFEIDDEKVLKLAKNQKGIAQNEAEVDTSRYSDCVVKCFEWADDYSWVIEENCMPARKSDFKRLLSIDFDTFCDLLVYQHSMYSRRRFWYSKLKNDDEAYELVNKLYDEDEYGFVLQVLDLMANYSLPFGDLTRISSYGLVKRDGVPEIVIIDSGLNNDIYDTYYQRRR